MILMCCLNHSDLMSKLFVGGAYETRTRDLLRDRQAF